MDASLEMYRELRRSVQRGAGDAAEDAAGTADVGIGARLGGSLSRLGIVGSVGETVERYAHKNRCCAMTRQKNDNQLWVFSGTNERSEPRGEEIAER